MIALMNVAPRLRAPEGKGARSACTDLHERERGDTRSSRTRYGRSEVHDQGGRLHLRDVARQARGSQRVHRRESNEGFWLEGEEQEEVIQGLGARRCWSFPQLPAFPRAARAWRRAPNTQRGGGARTTRDVGVPHPHTPPAVPR